MKTSLLLVFALILGLSYTSTAQKINQDYVLNIKKTDEPINIDGILDEDTWSQADVTSDFHSVLPMDTSLANIKTEIRMAYDNNFIYLSATCFHPEGQDYIVESLRRDWSFGRNDNFIFFMDPFDDQTNGYTFGANAAGAQWDGMLFEGGSANLSWDNKWYSETTKHSDKFIIEMAIPFKSIRYKKGIDQWGINFSRLDLRSTEKSAWAPVPRQFPTASLAYTGILQWDAPPPASSSNVSVIPYALGGVSKDYVEGTPTSKRFDGGMDAKVAVTSSLNLDLTVNPDFSQVEVDRQVTNLDRFELLFPERRQFFLENADLFSNFGFQNIRPFFSRRVGLTYDSTISQTIQNRIHYGARLSGKINKNWRIGLLNMQTAKQEEIGQPIQNYTTVSLQRKVFSRSNIGLILNNKQSVNYTYDDSQPYPEYTQYNRNMGLEYNLATSNNLLTGKAFMMKSFSPEETKKGLTYGAQLKYSARNLGFEVSGEYVAPTFDAEMGYIRRKNYYRVSPSINYKFFPNGGNILSHGPGFGMFMFTDEQFSLTDNTMFLYYNVGFRSRSNLRAWVAQDFVKLRRQFDPTNQGLYFLNEGTEHTWNAMGLNFTSKPQSIFTYSTELRYGGYYADGNRFNITGQAGYRFQPFVNITVNADYNIISLPFELTNSYDDIKFLLIGPRVDVTLTNKLYFTGFMQYNQQQENINLNTRLQWRYSPASDLFIVYTDNYLPYPFNVKSRSLIVKLTYWWNI